MSRSVHHRRDQDRNALASITQRLVALRRRLLLKRLAGALFNSFAGAAVVAGLVWLVLVTFEPGREQASRFFILWAVFGILGFLLLIVLILSRRPTVIEVARRVEVTLGLDERLSTSLEIAHGTIVRPGLSIVADALIDDTVGRARADFAIGESLFSRSVPQYVLAATALLVLAAVILVRPNEPVEPAQQLAETSSASPPALALTNDEAETLRADIETLAALVAADAADADDPFLAGVARDIEGLAGAVEGGGDRLELASRLEQLADLADVGYQALPGGSRGGSPPEAMERLTALADQIAAATETQLADAAQPDQEPDLTDIAQADPAVRDPATPREANAEGPVGDIGQDLARPDRPANMGDAGLEIDEAILGEAQWGEVDPQLEQARRNLQEQLGEFAVQAVGAAQNAGRGAGDVAGDGQQPLEGGGDPVELDTAFDRREEVLIAGDGEGEGARVRIDAAPDADYTAPEAAMLQAGAWERLTEAATRRSMVGGDAIAVIARYFTRLDEGIGE